MSTSSIGNEGNAGEPAKGCEKSEESELAKFEARQERELHAFEEQERRELEEFERKERESFAITIDRDEYKVHGHELTGRELRALPHPPIAADRDLFEVVPHGSDRKIEDNTVVRMCDGLRFFTAPAHINPGCSI